MLRGEDRVRRYAKLALEHGGPWALDLILNPYETYDSLREEAAYGFKAAKRVLEEVPYPPLSLPSPPPQYEPIDDLGGAVLASLDGIAAFVPKSWLGPPQDVITAVGLGYYLRGKYPEDVLNAELWDIVEHRRLLALDLLRGRDRAEELALEAAMRSTKVWPILALLLGRDVTEVYGLLNNPVYVDHVEAGRLTVQNVILTPREFEKIRTLVELHPHGRLDLTSPTAKVDIALRGEHVRLAVDVPPAATPSIDARNLSALPRLPLPRLIRLGTLNLEEAAFLLESLHGGTPVLVAGPTGSGKTTLSNALLAFSDPHWRIVSVEEVREIEDLSRYGLKHHAYAVPSDRVDAVVMLLHRNPDLVFLGEILTAEHARAFGFARDSGFRVLATTHAKDSEGLRRKWEEWGALSALDGALIAFMTRDKRLRGLYSAATFEKVDPQPSERYLELILAASGASTNAEVISRLTGVSAWIPTSGGRR